VSLIKKYKLLLKMEGEFPLCIYLPFVLLGVFLTKYFLHFNEVKEFSYLFASSLSINTGMQVIASRWNFLYMDELN